MEELSMSSNRELTMSSYVGIGVGLMLIVGIEVMLTYRHLSRDSAVFTLEPGVAGGVHRHHVPDARQVREANFVLDDFPGHALCPGLSLLPLSGCISHVQHALVEVTPNQKLRSASNGNHDPRISTARSSIAGLHGKWRWESGPCRGGLARGSGPPARSRPNRNLGGASGDHNVVRRAHQRLGRPSGCRHGLGAYRSASHTFLQHAGAFG